MRNRKKIIKCRVIFFSAKTGPVCSHQAVRQGLLGQARHAPDRDLGASVPQAVRSPVQPEPGPELLLHLPGVAHNPALHRVGDLGRLEGPRSSLGRHGNYNYRS